MYVDQKELPSECLLDVSVVAIFYIFSEFFV